MSDLSIPVGVIGVGSMGKHHARVYNQLSDAKLVGIHDKDRSCATEIALNYGTEALSLEELLSRAEAVSVAVPTQFHYEIARKCLESDVAVLVEKPLVKDIERGEELVRLADDRDLTLQAGHIEQFNPAIETVAEFISQLDIIALEARRLGPEPDREIRDTVVADLMIHDLGIITNLVESNIASINSIGTANANYSNAHLEFDNGVIASLTASRRTQQKIRKLNITTGERYIKVDYIDKSVEIYRKSVPEYVVENGDVHHRHESIIERPAVRNQEPLKKELATFLDCTTSGQDPLVSGSDALNILKFVKKIEGQAFTDVRS